MAIRRDGGLLAEETTNAVIGAFYRVYNALGFGFLESVYAAALAVELDRRNRRVFREYSVVIAYEGVEIARQRLDMVVDECVVIEIKASEHLHKDAGRQLYNYLRATNLNVGLVLHFGREPKFYRVICQVKKHRDPREDHPTDSKNPNHP